MPKIDLSSLKHQLRTNNPKFKNAIFNTSKMMNQGLINKDNQLIYGNHCLKE